jgi:hypothetical protein
VLTEFPLKHEAETFAPSSKDIAPLVKVTQNKAILDSILVPSDWGKESRNGVYIPQWVREQAWMMSSKAAIVVDEPDEREIKTKKIFEVNARVKWISLENTSAETPPSPGENQNNSNH